MKPLSFIEKTEIAHALDKLYELFLTQENWGRLPVFDGVDSENFLAMKPIVYSIQDGVYRKEPVYALLKGDTLKETDYTGMKFSLTGGIVVSCDNYELFDVIYDLLSEQVWDKSFAAHAGHFHPDLQSFNNCMQTTHVELLHIIRSAKESLTF